MEDSRDDGQGDGRIMHEAPQSRARVVAKVVPVVLIGMLAGGALNVALGERGADTPALAVVGGGVAFAVAILAEVRRRARNAPDD